MGGGLASQHPPFPGAERLRTREEASMSCATASAPESEPEGFFREPRMVAIEGARRAAERLWREIGLLLIRESGSAVQPPF